MARAIVLVLLVVGLALAQDRPIFRVKVDLVVLSFTVTDSKGHYVNALKPQDFRILEDGIPQKIHNFGEGSTPPVELDDAGKVKPVPAPVAAVSGSETNVV